jgi:hypothetical protein
MRLTLRTLLAYMDQILEPADTQDIAKKIEESEFATTLMHRTRDVCRRLRLAAPKLEGRGMGLDPNTVAEYLDNTLPAERVADFEKVCLESDVHLAEVASAHQILALVLGEPAEISTSNRQRMYALLNDPRSARRPSDTPSSAQPAATPAGAISGSAVGEVKSMRKKPEIPEYLRESPRPKSGGRLVMITVLLLIAACAALVFTNIERFREWTQVAQAPDAGQPTIEALPTKPGTASPSGQPPVQVAGQPPAGTSPPALEQPPERTPVADQSPPVGPPAAIPAMPANVAAASGNPPAAAIPPVPSAAPIPQPPVAQLPNGQLPASQPSVSQPTTMPAAALASTPQPPAAGAPAAGAPAAGSPAAGIPPGGSPGTTPPQLASAAVTKPASPLAPTSVPETQAVNPEGIGRLISEREILLRYDPKKQQWRRLPTRTTLYPGDRLLSLPTFRSNISLTVGVNVQLLGGTEIELQAADSRGVPGIRLEQGRLIMLTVGRPDAQVRLAVGQRQGFVTFGDGDSTLAVEAKRVRPDGADPEHKVAPFEIELYAASGEIHWADGSTPQSDILKAPTNRSLGTIKSATPIPETTVPTWIRLDERTPVEKRASVDVEESLAEDRPIGLGLKELAGDRRIEVSSLAVQCLADIGDFDSFVTSLNDASQRAAWNAQIEALRDAIDRSPATAKDVHDALVRHRGPDKGEELYRMLWGYSLDQLQAGSAALLVKYLDHDELDFRVLSFWNLNHITGAQHYYRPEYSAAKRQQYVAKWKQKLDSGQLIPK